MPNQSPPEVEVNNRCAEPQASLQTPKCWYVLYTRSRFEKRVYDELISNGIEAFLPMYKTMRQWSDRKKMVELPLFTGYVFVHIEQADYYNALQAHGAVKYVTFEGRAVEVPQQQIDNLHLIINSNAKVEVSCEEMQLGEEVKVVMGALKGLTGELVQVNRKKRVVVCVNNLEQNLLVSIRSDYLEKIPASTN